MSRATLILIAIHSIALSFAFADEADERAEILFTQFMPPCCYTGLLSEHHSGTADEMKEEIRALVREGKSDREIQDVFVARYGERILSHPREEGFNRLAVITPIVIFVAGFFLVGAILRGMRRRPAAAVSEMRRVPSLDDATDDAIEREIREGR